jgi:acyl-CoA thioesterase-1
MGARASTFYYGIQMRLASLLIGCLLLCGCGSPPSQPSPPSEPPPSAEPEPAPRSAAPDARPVIVAFGDSLTAGFGADPGKSYPDFLQQELDRRGYRYRVVNAGISGETTTDALARLSTVTALKPAVVIVEFGGNDGLRGLPIATTSSNLDQIVTELQQSGAAILLAGMTLPPNYGPDYINDFQRIYSGLATKHKVALIPFLLAGVAGPTHYMQQDGLHPTGEGNRLVAETVVRYLEPLLHR